MTGMTIDLAAVKAKQQAAWSTGDYSVVGTTLQIVGESLCEALDLRPDERVLDVAAGNGNATLAAARRWANVVSTDYVPSLLDAGRRRAEAEGHTVRFQLADAEALPFPDDAFDVVLSTFGVMFTADQAQAARELVRVTRPGGRIGLANWTPDGFVGQLFRTLAAHVPPAAGVRSPSLWGTPDHLAELFGGAVSLISIERRHFSFRYRSADHFLDVFRTYYGPMQKAYSALDAEGQAALTRDLMMLMERFDRSRGAALIVPSEYLEVVIQVA